MDIPELTDAEIRDLVSESNPSNPWWVEHLWQTSSNFQVAALNGLFCTGVAKEIDEGRTRSLGSHSSSTFFEAFINHGGMLHPGLGVGVRVAAFEKLWNAASTEVVEQRLGKLASLAFSLERMAAHPLRRPKNSSKFKHPIDENGKRKVDLSAVELLRRRNPLSEIKIVALDLCNKERINGRSLGYTLAKALQDNGISDAKNDLSYPVVRSLQKTMLEIMEGLSAEQRQDFVEKYFYNGAAELFRKPQIDQYYLQKACDKLRKPKPARVKKVTNDAAPV